MEIHVLKLLITDKDLNDVAARRLTLDDEVRKLRIQITPQGVRVTGVYQMLVTVAFETLWEVTALKGKLTARLSAFKALGIPVSLFKSMVMGAVKDAFTRHDAIQVDGDTVLVDLDQWLAKQGMPLETNLTLVQCRPGYLFIEAAKAPEK
jgi:hypothetical protein